MLFNHSAFHFITQFIGFPLPEQENDRHWYVRTNKKAQ